MPGRIGDRSLSAVTKSQRSWMMRVALCYHLVLRNNISLCSVSAASSRYFYFKAERAKLIHRPNRISLLDFNFNLNSFSDCDCLQYFRFTKPDLLRVVDAINWPLTRTNTKKNRYSTNGLLCACVLLRRLSTACRWWDLELFFGKHGPQLSEIFWETLENMLNTRGHLLRGIRGEQFMSERASIYAEAIYEKSGALSNCVGFIDGTVIGIARPTQSMWQRVAYNGHKRKHALKFQSLTTPDGLILDAFGPIEGRRHDWTLYIRSEAEDQLPLTLEIDGFRYCIFGDSGYNERGFLRVPFQGSNLTTIQKAFNKAMSSVRVTVEWVFKEIKAYWPVLDCKRKMRVLESPIGLIYLGAMLLHNFRACIYPKPVSQYFNCSPPTLDDYLAIDESL